MGTQSTDALIPVLWFGDPHGEESDTSDKSLCSWILKRLTCLFHGTLATLSEYPLRGATVLDEAMPVFIRLFTFLECSAS